MHESQALDFMDQAIEKMRLSGRVPKVGAVLVKAGVIISREHNTPELHAEHAAIEAAIAQGVDLRDATLYTTLEPCVSIRSKKESPDSR